jgi:hypothetical protein
MPSPVDLLLETRNEEEHRGEFPTGPLVFYYFDYEQWKSRAESALLRSRRAMMEHRKRQVMLCDASKRRIEYSRSLLKESVPARPGWL